MRHRSLCADKGFDAEPDLMDGYTNDTGFALTEADQLRYVRWLADEAHYQGTRITREAMCAEADRLGFDALYKRYDLDAWRQGCDQVLNTFTVK